MLELSHRTKIHMIHHHALRAVDSSVYSPDLKIQVLCFELRVVSVEKNEETKLTAMNARSLKWIRRNVVGDS